MFIKAFVKLANRSFLMFKPQATTWHQRSQDLAVFTIM